MRKADIKVGEEYAIGWDNPRAVLSRGVVLEVGLHRQVWSGGWFRSRSANADGVRVRITERYGSELDPPQESIVQTRQIVRPWAEHEEVHQQRQEAEAKARAHRNAQRDRKAKLIAYAEERLGYGLSAKGYGPDYIGPDYITLTLDEVEDLLNWSDQ